MSVRAIQWALTEAQDLPPSCVAVLVGLANHADDMGRNAYPSESQLAQYARKSARAVRNDLAVLLERRHHDLRKRNHPACRTCLRRLDAGVSERFVFGRSPRQP